MSRVPALPAAGLDAQLLLWYFPFSSIKKNSGNLFSLLSYEYLRVILSFALWLTEPEILSYLAHTGNIG